MNKQAYVRPANWLLGVLVAGSVLALPADGLAQRRKAKEKAAENITIAAPALPEPIKGASVEGITEYTLANGLKVLLFPDNSQQTITVNITYMVGSRHEGYGETGMAHLLEHMVFKGTPRHPNIPQELTEHGARPNGTTWLDRTNYYETFAANEKNLRWALDMEADRMINSFIKKEDLESEFSVVRNEFEMGENNPGSVLRERIISTAYLWHNYGNSTIGSREDIERVPIQNLQAFYRKYYQPDNAILVVAGKIDPKATLQMVNEYFGPIPRPERVLQPTYTVEPKQEGERSVVLRRTGDVQYLGAMYHISPGSHPDYAPLDVLVDILTEEPAGPLYKALVDTKKATLVYGFPFQLKEPGLAYFAVEVPKDKDLADANATFLKTLDEVATMNFTKADVERAKTKSAKQFELLSRNTEALGRTLSEFIAMGDWRLLFLYRDAIEKVTVDDVKRVAAYYFKPANRTSGKFIPDANPDRVQTPEAPNIDKLVANYKGRTVVSEGEVFDPSTTNIESRTRRGTLANGMQYAFLPKETRGDVVSANITLRFGDVKSLQNLGMADNLAGSLLMRGTKTLSRQALKDSIDRMKAQISVYGGGNSAGANITTTRDNLPAAMRLVADILKNPAYDAEEFSKMIDEQRTGIESQLNDPMALASSAFGRVMNPYPPSDIRYNATMQEQLEMLKTANLDAVKKFHKDFYGASDATVSVVGDFDEAVIKDILAKEFGTWKSPRPYARLASDFKAVEPGSQAIKTPDKPNAMFLAGMTLNLDDKDPAYPALVMANYMLGGGFLNSRLATRIRQKDGLSYGVGSNLSAGALDKVGAFVTYAIYAPENAAKLEAAFVEELNKVRNEGFTEDELKAARDGFLQSRQVSRAKDNELAGKLNGYLNLKRDMSFDADFEEKVKALTVQQINEAFRKYVDPSKVMIIKAGDFDKKVEKKEDTKGKAAGVSSDGKN